MITLSAGAYARFAMRIEMANIPDLFNHAFGEWLPSSGKTQRAGAVFEVYPDDPDATETSRMLELWIPVVA